ncbi:MAG: hypothetical protein L0207_01015 [Chlamydiae bacterium]|nr:hypothetical protein [Chlamydiota bacterium]
MQPNLNNISKETQQYYQCELRKAKLYSISYTLFNYICGFIKDTVSLPLQPLKIFKFLCDKGIPSKSQKTTADFLKQNFHLLPKEPSCRPIQEKTISSALLHEHAHIYYGHQYWLISLELAEFFTAPFVLMKIPKLLFPFLIVTFAIRTMMSNHFEKQADFWAMDAIQSNQGLTKLWKKRIEDYIPFGNVIQHHPNLNDEQDFEIRRQRVPSDHTHPWAGGRYEYCRTYIPK